MSAPDLVVWVEAHCRECAWSSGPCRSQALALATYVVHQRRAHAERPPGGAARMTTTTTPLPVESARRRAFERLVLRVELGPGAVDAFDEENTGSRQRRAAYVRIRAGRAVNRAAIAADARRQGGAGR